MAEIIDFTAYKQRGLGEESHQTFALRDALFKNLTGTLAQFMELPQYQSMPLGECMYLLQSATVEAFLFLLAAQSIAATERAVPMTDEEAVEIFLDFWLPEMRQSSKRVLEGAREKYRAQTGMG